MPLKKLICILTLLLTLLSVPTFAQDTFDNRILAFGHATPDSRRQADSMMHVVASKALFYADAISRYQSEIYIKGRTEILKKNALIRYANRIFPVNRRNKDMLFEIVTDTEYDAPNSFRHTIKAVHGNSIPDRYKCEEALNFLNINIYSPTAYNDAIIMPIARNAYRHYHFNVENIDTTQGEPVYQIRFLPKQWSQKLVCGDMWVRDGTWKIEKIDFNGRVQFAQFNIMLQFGNGSQKLIMPEVADLKLRYQVLGNVVETNYHIAFNFNEVEWVTEDYFADKWKPLDLTQYYTITMDSVPIVNDSAYWANERDTPLTAEEQKLLHTVAPVVYRTDTSQMLRYMDLTEQLTSSKRFDYKQTRFRYSGFLNPAQLGYSARNGITYKQRLRINKTFNDGQSFYFRPEVGFVFKRKEVFFKVYGDWQYKPEKKGGISLLVANGNDSYPSQMMDSINMHLKDSAFNFSDLDLPYFRHYFAELKNQIELTNGLLLNTGISYHSRIPVTKQTEIDPGDDVENLIHDTYNDFTPTLGFVYTPRQFYRMIGRQKEYVYSYYPTLSVELARAIPGIFNSSGDYGRIEASLEQSLPMGLLKRLNYYVSGGTYFNAKSTYFADFTYFARRNFPDSWNDQIGGVFNLLGREWYNAADKYVQAHLLYETPFLLFQWLKRSASKYVLSERMYLGQLWTPALPCYTEIGYGFGNHLFSVAAFAAFDRHEYQGAGFKFAFELFQ